MRILHARSAGLIAGMLLVSGCDRGAPPATRVTAVVTGSGVARGHVRFIGTPPVMGTIRNEPCCQGSPPLKEETTVVDSSGGLKNAIVLIEHDRF